MQLKLEDVFKLSGVPTFTFVKPVEYTKLLVSLRTPGRGVVIEGPSGIGKTTSVHRALEELGIEKETKRLSGRKPSDVETIRRLIDTSAAGTVIVDDFHRLDEGLRQKLADYLKVLADEERRDTKLVIVGINRAGEGLMRFGDDLYSRIDIIPFESNPDHRVKEVLTQGEKALNIKFSTADEIVTTAAGSFFLAQYLSHETCLYEQITESQTDPKELTASFEVIRERVIEDLGRRFMQPAITFATGTRLRREGRAPYLHILKWLAEANEWSIQLDREMAVHPELRGSVGQVLEGDYISEILRSKPELGNLFHYDPDTRVLAVEDPQFVFFLRNLLWNNFGEKVGYINVQFDSRYDFALSFAGPDRKFAEHLFKLLQEQEFEIFYDKHEQHRILAENVEEYLAPIYRTEAKYIICFLGPEYPKRVWCKFESQQFKERFAEKAVIPIWFTTARPGIFDESARVGGFVFDPTGDVDAQLKDFANELGQRIGADGTSRRSWR